MSDKRYLPRYFLSIPLERLIRRKLIKRLPVKDENGKRNLSLLFIGIKLIVEKQRYISCFYEQPRSQNILKHRIIFYGPYVKFVYKGSPVMHKKLISNILSNLRKYRGTYRKSSVSLLPPRAGTFYSLYLKPLCCPGFDPTGYIGDCSVRRNLKQAM